MVRTYRAFLKRKVISAIVVLNGCNDPKQTESGVLDESVTVVLILRRSKVRSQVSNPFKYRYMAEKADPPKSPRRSSLRRPSASGLAKCMSVEGIKAYERAWKMRVLYVFWQNAGSSLRKLALKNVMTQNRLHQPSEMADELVSGMWCLTPWLLTHRVFGPSREHPSLSGHGILTGYFAPQADREINSKNSNSLVDAFLPRKILMLTSASCGRCTRPL